MSISPQWVVMMARYNAWQNAWLIPAADSISQAARDQDRAGFWRSITGTTSHLLWGDAIWMSRFDGGENPNHPIAKSHEFVTDWNDFKSARQTMDDRIMAWANTVTQADIDTDYAWHSASAGSQVSRPKALIFTHFFNHQTHHRGQLHAMLTQAGAKTSDTDLFFMPLDQS